MFRRPNRIAPDGRGSQAMCGDFVHKSIGDSVEILTACPKCKKAFRADDGEAGDEVKCARCGTTYIVPLPASSDVKTPNGEDAIEMLVRAIPVIGRLKTPISERACGVKGPPGYFLARYLRSTPAASLK